MWQIILILSKDDTKRDTESEVQGERIRVVRNGDQGQTDHPRSAGGSAEKNTLKLQHY